LVNDNYGHQVGDDAIRLVSKLMQESSRDIDTCGRYGGEEFVAILPNTDAEGALTYCERLRVLIAKQMLESEGKIIQFTISLGIAQLNERIEDHSSWIVCADKALYQSKDGGRNQTNIYQ
jgi:diguanylate cyclase (GGDEF)-like protein